MLYRILDQKPLTKIDLYPLEEEAFKGQGEKTLKKELLLKDSHLDRE